MPHFKGGRIQELYSPVLTLKNVGLGITVKLYLRDAGLLNYQKSSLRSL